MSNLKRALLYLLAVSMIAIGVAHFVAPEPFERIVPPFLGDAKLLVLVSGFFEVAGGVGLLIPRTRRAAAWGLIALFVAVFPANVYMAVEGIQLNPDKPMPEWGAWLRLPFQFLFIAWAAWFAGRPTHAEDARSGD